MRFYAFGSAAKPGAGNSSKIVKHWAVQFGTHNRLFIDEVQPCEGLERQLTAFKTLGFLPRRHRCRSGKTKRVSSAASYAPACNINP